MIAESVGAEARFLTRAPDFFSAVRDWAPTHVAVDLVMPVMDGVEVLVELAALQCRAKIIITSGLGTRVLDAACRSANEHGLAIAGVLSKPFSPNTLRTLLLEDSAQEEHAGRAEPSPRRRSESTATLDIAEIRRALENGEFVLAYQPQVRCATGEVAGFEALVRWEHPSRGTMRPDQFIPRVEECGFIDELTEQVIDMAVRWFAPRFGGSNLTISVNLSSRGSAGGTPPTTRAAPDLGGRGLVDRIVRLCHLNDLRPENIVLELTETGAMADPVASLDLLTRLRMKSIQLSIDDFGTGY